MTNLGAQSVLHPPRARWQVNCVKGGVTWLESLNQVLRREQEQVLLNRQDTGLPMEVFYGRKRVTSGNETEGAILHKLKAANGRLSILRVDDWRGEVENRPDQRFERERQTLLVMAEGSASESAHHIDL